jgi:5-formyltetrahydrofolate cyclo-ligase
MEEQEDINFLLEQIKLNIEKEDLRQLSIEEQKELELLNINIEKEDLIQLSIEEQKELEQLKINNELKFEIIVTSNKYEQIIIYITMSKDVSEKEFIDNILKSLDKKYFNTLVKLSCCQLYCESDNDLKEFLFKSNGKYYFNDKKF